MSAEGSHLMTVLPRRGAPVKGVLLILAYMVVLVAPLVVAGIVRPKTGHTILWELGKSFALVAVVILVLQFVLAARLRRLCRHYGLDMVLRFHKGMAVFAVVLLVLHPFLFVIAGAGWDLLLSLRVPWYIWMGKIGLLLLLVQALTIIFRRKVRLDFEKWRLLHNQAVVIVSLVLVHSWFAGGDLRHRPMQILWIGLAAVAVLSYTYHKLYMPWIGRRHAYRVADVTPVTHNVWTLSFEPPEAQDQFLYLPGQFHFISLYRGDKYDGEEHPFTISSSPSQPGQVTSTINESGNFTSTIGETKPGDLVRIQGPFGRFTHVLRPEETDIVFIAGGIGITPLMSMLRYMWDNQADVDVLLVYGNRTERDIVFRAELDNIAEGARPRLSIVHILSEADKDWAGESGYVDEDKLRHYCGEGLADKSFYLCGPPAMMNIVTRTLRGLGVPAGSIHSERFSL